MEIQQRAGERALAIDDGLGEAYLGKAELLAFNQQREEADAAYRKAIELSPGYSPAYHWYGNFLSESASRLDESLAMLEKALELDPLSSIVRASLAGRYNQMGRYAEAERELDRLQEIDPGFVPAFSIRADLASQRGRFDEQIRWLLMSAEADPGRLTHYIPLMWAYVDIDYVEPLQDIKRRMAVINEEHALLGVADLVVSVHAGNYQAALESGQWAYERMGRPPFFSGFFAYINTLKGDYVAASEAFESAYPGLFDRAQWPTAIAEHSGDGCIVGWVLMRAGDASLGKDLIRATMGYLEQELPRYVQHADRFGLDACHVALGDNESALAAIETRVDHNHWGQWWFWRRAPMFEPLWGEPRFEAALQRIQDDLAVQRANLQRGGFTARF